MIFTYLFYKHIMFRKSCGVCHFCNTTRPSDITIADFWGWEKTDPNFNKDDKGCNLILVNTEKGRQLFDKVKDRMNIIPADLENCLQTHLRVPSDIHPQRDSFEADYKKYGFSYCLKKYGDVGLKHRIFAKVKRIIEIVKNKIAKLR